MCVHVRENMLICKRWVCVILLRILFVCVCLSGVCTTAVWQWSDISCSDILSQFISPASGWTEALEGHTSTSDANLSFCQHQWGALHYISHRHTHKCAHTYVFSPILLLFDVKWHSDCEVQTVDYNLWLFNDKFDEQLQNGSNFFPLQCVHLIKKGIHAFPSFILLAWKC